MTEDILVLGLTAYEHHRNLMAFLKRLEERGFNLILEKSEFYKEKITFFRLRFTLKGISPTEDRAKAFKEAQPPKDAKVLLSFLCIIWWSFRFMLYIQSIVEPLWLITKVGNEWEWGLKEQQAFEAIKMTISTKSVGYFRTNWTSLLTVDASSVGFGNVLQQFNPIPPLY